jgi:hypothetical protein
MIRLFGFLSAGTAVYFALRQTWRTFRDLGSKRHPKFFYKDVKAEELGIPVFTYHSIANRVTPDSVTPAEFDRHMRHLADNGYHALSADELHDHLVYGSPVPPKSVMITFDDGRATLWTVAYPILKKYNLKAVSFIVPGMMSEAGVRPTLSDYEAGKAASFAELLNADLSDTPAITWDEARVMHASGLVDFQSHTLDHTLIHCTPEIVDFVNPTFPFGYNNFGVSVIRYGGVDRVHSRPRLGTPIYRHQPRMSAARRFFDDEEVRNACVDYVEKHGGEAFFRQPGWRADLFRFVEAHSREHELQETFETKDEQAQAIRDSLIQSKQLIEEHLADHTVCHLCYPWHRYSALAASLAREAGYVTAFIDINPQKPFPIWNDPYIVQRVLPINEYGDDPYQITRIDARDNLLLSLPGKRRLTYTHRFASRLLRVPRFLRS